MVVPHGFDIDLCRFSQLSDGHFLHGALDSVLRYAPRLDSTSPKRKCHATWTTTGSLLAGAAAALGASACCAGPLLLVVLGVGGAWSSRLAALRPFQPLFVPASVAFFAMAFHRLYIRAGKCAEGQACSVLSMRYRQRVVFWVVVAAALALMSFPLYAPLFY
ncbi:mercuric transporter MerT family protein [Paraburkholderia sp. PGU19]|uniref:mercuric transporter MerT family protein n=1 Tax=Paraburkholderia sp. PGU19 TaxID=2735434 RepID=UPI0015D9917A|nr:mercuric transporter MerT family protein [Paraburkholderia sp. PGU19]